MSRINIQGTIDNIKSKSNVYTPVIESIVNSIQSISDKEENSGKIEIVLHREEVIQFENDVYGQSVWIQNAEIILKNL